MKPHHLIVVLLLCVSTAVAVCAIRDRSPGPRGSVESQAVLAVGLAQVALCAAWLAWGRRFVLLRLAALVAGVVGWAYPLTRWNERPPTEWMFVLSCYAALVGAALLVPRAAGWRAEFGVGAAKDERRKRRGRFSLWELFTLTTALALLAGLWTWLQVPWNSFVDAVSFSGLFGVAACVSLLIGAVSRRPLWTILGALAVMLTGGCLLGAMGADRDYTVVLGVLCGYPVLAMQALRAGGLRLRRTQTPASSPAQSAMRIQIDAPSHRAGS